MAMGREKEIQSVREEMGLDCIMSLENREVF